MWYGGGMWKMFRSRVGGWILGILFALLVLEMVLFSPAALDPVEEKVAQPAAAESSQNETAAQVMTGINVVEIREQHKDWELWSERATSQTGEGDLDLEKVKIRFYGPEGIEYLVTGNRGSVEGESKDMRIEGQVMMESSNGYHFKTESMIYTSDTRTLHATQAVDVQGPPEPQGGRLQLNGIGMEAMLDGETMKLLSDVRASKRVAQRGGALMGIRAGSAELSARTKEINFAGNVSIQLEEVKVTGPSAKFVYDQSGRRLGQIELAGGVRVSDWDKFATSDSVKLDLNRNQFMFKGRPRVVQGADELFGDEITFLDGGKQVKVKNARVRLSREKLEGVN